MDAALPVKIREIIPSAVYRGQVYTQDVEVELDDGPTFRVYDTRRRVTRDMVDASRAIGLLVFIAVVERDDGPAGVALDAEDQPVFRGEVVALDDDSDSGLLDVGPGTVTFEPSDCGEPIDVGDRIRIARSARHLHGVEGERRGEDRRSFFEERLDADDPEDRIHAAWFFGTFALADGLDPVAAVLGSDPEPDVRRAAAEAVGQIGRGAEDEVREPARNALRSARTDPDETVCETVEHQLDHLDDKY